MLICIYFKICWRKYEDKRICWDETVNLQSTEVLQKLLVSVPSPVVVVLHHTAWVLIHVVDSCFALFLFSLAFISRFIFISNQTFWRFLLHSDSAMFVYLHRVWPLQCRSITWLKPPLSFRRLHLVFCLHLVWICLSELHINVYGESTGAKLLKLHYVVQFRVTFLCFISYFAMTLLVEKSQCCELLAHERIFGKGKNVLFTLLYKHKYLL